MPYHTREELKRLRRFRGLSREEALRELRRFGREAMTLNEVKVLLDRVKAIN